MQDERQSKSALVSRNVRVGRRRTSIKLEPVFWNVLEEVCQREGKTLHEICTMVAERAGDYGLTGAIRVFLLTYAWTAGLDSSLRTVPTGKLPADRAANQR